VIDTTPPDGSNNAEFRKMSTDRIKELGPLAVEHQTHPVHVTV
jgi:hypothetical protein